MTIEQLVEKRVPKIRRVAWNKHAYLELHLVKGGGYGPWAKLIDPPSQQTWDIEHKEGQDIFMFSLDTTEDGWEEFK